MFKRVVAGILWFLLGVNAWPFVAALTGVNTGLGIVLGVLLAGIVLVRTRADAPSAIGRPQLAR